MTSTSSDWRGSEKRLHNVVEAIELATVGDGEKALTLLARPGEDSFGLLEAAIATFVRSQASVLEESQQMISSLVATQAEMKAALETVEQQRESIRELSTPIIDVWEEILALPLVGAIDTVRALDMTEQLLERVVRARARFVIVDLTGIGVVDTSTADHLVKMTKAASLLGAECVVTGIGPDMARTLVGLGISFGEIRTMRTLRDGLRHCLLRKDSENGSASLEASRPRR